MNSSGIKRGLATTAVSALAIAGLPLFASSASAAPGDAITIVSQSPVRNGGDQGLLIQVTLKGVNENFIKIADSNLNDQQPDNATQDIGTLTVVDSIANGDPEDSNPNDGLAEAVLRVAPITTSADGGSFNFALYEDERTDPADAATDNDTVDAAEARVQVTGTTSGAPTAIQVTPNYQAAPLNTDSGNYTAVLKDSAGRTTQLTGDQEIRFEQVSQPTGGDADFNPAGPLSDDAVGADGTFTFKAQGDTAGLYGLRAGVFTDNADTVVDLNSNTVNLDVSGSVAGAGTIESTEIDVQTGADDRAGFPAADDDDATVRTDQSSVTFAIKDLSQANKIVSLTADGNGVTFGGKDTQTQTVTLNDKGEGSVTFTVDASSIADGESFVVDGTALADPFTVNYETPSVDEADGASVDADATTYISSYGGTVNPVVTVLDQFGNPVSGVFVTYDLDNGANAGAESARVQTGADGKVTFAIKDTKASATNNGTDDITFRVYSGQFDTTVLADDSGSDIVYTADGQGADYLLTVDGQTPGAAAYNPKVVPLTDAVGDDPSEIATVLIAGGTPGAAATVTVDNGALILSNANDNLSSATASKSGVVGDTFEVVGTKEGVVNITVTSGGRTKTATLTVEAPANNSTTARNISLEGPDGAVAGDVVDFVATITDAFGNPVTGYDDADIIARVTGSGTEQGSSGDSNAAGQITFQVEINEGASNPVTLRLEANDAQFGAAANRLTEAATTDNAPGLSASNDTASATVDVVNIEELEQAVEDAERDLAESEANLATAVADRDVAQAQLAVQQAEVDRLKERKAELRQKLNKAKANGNRQKAKTTRKKLRSVKQQLNDAKDAVVVAQTNVDGYQKVVDLRQIEVDKAEEALAQAQADLEEAQN